MQNRRNIAALATLVSEISERLTAAHERLVQTVTSLLQEDRAQLSALTDGLGDLRGQVSALTEAQQQTNDSVSALTEAQQRTNDSVSALTEAQQRTNDSVGTLTDGLNELRAQTATLTDGLNELRAQTATLTEGLNELRAQTAALTEGLNELRAQTAALTEGLNELRTQVSALAGAQQQTNNRVTEMNGHLTSLSGQVANLTGGRYEREVARLAPRYARRQLNLVNATITHTSWEPGDVVSSAVNSDDITDAEAEDLNRADLVITGGDTAGDTIHAIAEISLTVEPTDVIRSARRAVILRKATGQVVHAIAIGNAATPDAIALAESHNATILTVPAPAERD